MTREEFMDIVYSELHSDGDNYRANRIIDAADEYAEEQTRWIPVSERYPEDGQRVLVDYCDEDAGIMLIRFNVNGYHGFKAWMPLPEPYKASPTGAERSTE